MRILVADDDNLILQLATDILTDDKHEVFTAKNGREALEKAITKKPDIIILDIVLPGFLGTELCEKLRSYHGTAAIPILLVSSREEEILESGGPHEFLADDFLKKPFKPDVLLSKLAKLSQGPSQFANYCKQNSST